MKTMKIGLVALLVAFAVLMAAAPAAAHHTPPVCEGDHSGTCSEGQTCQVTGQECQMVWGEAKSGGCPGWHSSDTCKQDFLHHHHLVEECNDQYGCILTSCPAGQHIEGETCVPDVCGVDYCTDVGVHHCEDSECVLDTCGDGFCNDAETQESCPMDCGCPILGQVVCGDNTCCDLQADELNCGGCGNACFLTQTCSEGNCRFTDRGDACYSDPIFAKLDTGCDAIGTAPAIGLDSVDGERLYVTVTHWGGSFSCELIQHDPETEYSYAPDCSVVDYYHNGCNIERQCNGVITSFTSTGSRDFRVKCAPNSIGDAQPFQITVTNHFVDYSGASSGQVLDLHFNRTPDLQACRYWLNGLPQPVQL